MNIRKRLFRLRDIDNRESLSNEVKDELLKMIIRLDGNTNPSHVVSPVLPSKYSLAYNPFISSKW